MQSKVGQGAGCGDKCDRRCLHCFEINFSSAFAPVSNRPKPKNFFRQLLMVARSASQAFSDPSCLVFEIGANACKWHKEAMQSRIDDAHWSLAMALAWITNRTESAVINVRSARWAPSKTAIRDLLSALRSGKLIAHGMFEGERIPHSVETAIWSTFEIVVKPMRFVRDFSLTSVVIAQSIGHAQTRLLSTTVPAAKVRKLWPAAKLTVAAEAQCQEHLITAMQRSLNRAPMAKRDFYAECKACFPGLSERGFERAWARAKRLTGAAGWGKAGRRPK